MAKRVIKLLGEPIQNEDSKAAEAITPGHLVDFDGSGNLIKHANAGGFVSKAFALERQELGKGIDDAYAIGDYVKVGVFPPGTRVNAIIASGQNISKGNYLESAGDGTLRILNSGERIGRAVESVNNSAGPGTARIAVEIV